MSCSSTSFVSVVERRSIWPTGVKHQPLIPSTTPLATSTIQARIPMAENPMQNPRVMKIPFPGNVDPSWRMELYDTEDPNSTGFHVGAYMDMRHYQAYSRLSMTISDRIPQGHLIQALRPGVLFQYVVRSLVSSLRSMSFSLLTAMVIAAPGRENLAVEHLRGRLDQREILGRYPLAYGRCAEQVVEG